MAKKGIRARMAELKALVEDGEPPWATPAPADDRPVWHKQMRTAPGTMMASNEYRLYLFEEMKRLDISIDSGAQVEVLPEKIESTGAEPVNSQLLGMLAHMDLIVPLRPVGENRYEALAGKELVEAHREQQKPIRAVIIPDPAPLLDVVAVEALPGFSLQLTFENGEIRRFAMAPLLARGGPVFVPLRRLNLFRQVFIEHGTVCWPGGVDLDPELLYEQSILEATNEEEAYQTALLEASAYFDNEPDPGSPDGIRFAELIQMIEEYELGGTASTHITPAGGNVFLDLGFPPAEAAALKAESAAAASKAIAAKHDQTYASIKIENQFAGRALDQSGRVDLGIVFLCIPQDIAGQLGFDTKEVATREIVFAGDIRRFVPIVGPVRIHVRERFCDTSALVFGDEVLLGRAPLAMLD